jgi:ATP-dependent RNA helicase RhlE
VNRNLRAPKRVECGIAAPAETVEHALYPVQQHLKTALLLAILERMDRKSVLVFTRTKHRANRVMQQLEREGHAAGALHSNKSQNQRQAALDAFRSGECRILVATDIAARGIDVATISHVINYDVPDCADSYIHRIGRTGRAERDGEAITFISSGDAGVLRDIERTLRSSIERRTLEGFDYNQPATQGDEFYRAPQQHQQRRSFGGHPSAHASAAQTPMPERPRTHHKPAPLATPPAPRPRPSSPTDYPAAEFRPTSKGRPVAPHARHAGKPGGRPGGDAQPMHAQDQGRNKPRTKLPAQGPPAAAPGKRTTAPGGGKPWGRGGNSLAASQRGRRRG